MGGVAARGISLKVRTEFIKYLSASRRGTPVDAAHLFVSQVSSGCELAHG
jgi:hypothetical protein